MIEKQERDFKLPSERQGKYREKENYKKVEDESYNEIKEENKAVTKKESKVAEKKKSTYKIGTYCTSVLLNGRRGPGYKYEVVKLYQPNEKIQIKSVEDGWGKNSDGVYVKMEFLR